MSTYLYIIAVSDERLKEGIRQLDSKEAWQQVLALRGVSYQMKEKKNNLKTSSSVGVGDTHIGFLAQEVAEVVPEVVDQVRMCW